MSIVPPFLPFSDAADTLSAPCIPSGVAQLFAGQPSLEVFCFLRVSVEYLKLPKPFGVHRSAMASADYWSSAAHYCTGCHLEAHLNGTPARPSRVRAIAFTPCTRHIYYPNSASHACSSGRGFDSGFLQIPPRGGHPCH